MMLICHRCHTPMPDGAPLHNPHTWRTQGIAGWHIGPVAYCPACFAALLRGLPPVGAAS